MMPQIHCLKTLRRNTELNNSPCTYWSRMNCVKLIWLPPVKIRGFVDSEVIEDIIDLQWSLDRLSCDILISEASECTVVFSTL